jgi:hypothetical protein
MCAKTGALPAQRRVDLGLARRVHQVIIAANHMGDAHIMVVHHDGEIISRRAIGAQQDEIVEFLRRPPHLALHRILKDDVGVRRFEANGIGCAGGRLGGIPVAPGRPQRPAVLKCGVAQRFDLVWRQIAAKG